MSCRPARWLRLNLVSLLLLALAPSAGSGSEPIYRSLLRLPGQHERFGYPQSVTADLHTGEVFVCDTRGNRVLIFGPDGLFEFEIKGGDVFRAPLDLAVDPEGYLLVLASYRGRKRIIELDFDGLFRHPIELVGLPAEALPPDLISVALSPAGERIFALDRANVALLVAERGGEVLAMVDLAPELSGDDRQNLLLRHVDVYGDRVLVALPQEGKIQLFDLEGRPWGKRGKPGGTRCLLGRPTAAALDQQGDLLIIDQLRMVILRWSVSDDACLGEYWGFGDHPGYLYYPIDIALDLQGRAYVSQGFESRVQVYEGLPPAAGTRAASGQPRQ